MAPNDKKLNQPDEKILAGLKASKNGNSEMQGKTKQSIATDPFLDLTAAEREAVVKYLTALQTKPSSPRFKLSSDEEKLEVDQSSEPLVNPIFMNAFGSTDRAFIDGILSQFINIVSDGHEIDLRALNFAVSMIKGFEARNQPQTMLAALMTVIYMASMRFARSFNVRRGVNEEDITGRMLNKLARTFVSQIEAMQRLQTGGEKITQQISVAKGGQAIVGNFTQAPSGNIPERESEASPQVAPSDTNVVRMPMSEETKPLKGGFRRRLGK